MFLHEKLLGFFSPPKEIEIPKILVMKFHCDPLHIQTFG